MKRSRAVTISMSLFAGLAVSSTCLMGAASAAPSKWEPFHEEYGPEVSRSFCGVSGLTVEQRVVVDGRSRTTARGADRLPYYREHVRVTDTFTNARTGEYVTVETAYRGGAHRVTDNGDGTLTVVVQNTDNSFYYDANGEVIGHDAGLFRYKLRFDHGGTPRDPSDDELLAFVGVLKSVGRNDGFCTTLVTALT
jgi:hypothetical protein